MDQDRKTQQLPDFLWGVASSAYQIEGSTAVDGRGQSIWDRFCTLPGRVTNGDSGAYGCDSYRRLDEDLSLLRELGVGAYRFSLSWPRLQPGGRGRANQAGIDYYQRLIDGLLTAGIQPWITLYHWDLPQELEDAGGWLNRDTSLRFADYADLCIRSYGDRVGHWTSLNEPWCSAFLGYGSGEHAPGRRSPTEPFSAVHHLLLAHGLAGQVCRSQLPGARFGIVLNPSLPRPASATEADRLAAEYASVERTGLWLDALVNGRYPDDYLESRAARMPVHAGDLETIRAPLDFLGINYYNEDTVAAVAGPERFRMLDTDLEKTAMGWDIVPDGLDRLLRYIHSRWQLPAYYITENGAAFEDRTEADGSIEDGRRVDYLRSHLAVVDGLRRAGLPVHGYFAWTLMDNFEWAHGYGKKFGLVAVDRQNGGRRKKRSFHFYKAVICGRERLEAVDDERTA